MTLRLILYMLFKYASLSYNYIKIMTCSVFVKHHGMCYPVCWGNALRDPWLLMEQISSFVSEWSFTICPTPYNRKYKMC